MRDAKNSSTPIESLKIKLRLKMLVPGSRTTLICAVTRKYSMSPAIRLNSRMRRWMKVKIWRLDGLNSTSATTITIVSLDWNLPWKMNVMVIVKRMLNSSSMRNGKLTISTSLTMQQLQMQCLTTVPKRLNKMRRRSKTWQMPHTKQSRLYKTCSTIRMKQSRTKNSRLLRCVRICPDNVIKTPRPLKT